MRSSSPRNRGRRNPKTRFITGRGKEPFVPVSGFAHFAVPTQHPFRLGWCPTDGSSCPAPREKRIGRARRVKKETQREQTRCDNRFGNQSGERNVRSVRACRGTILRAIGATQFPQYESHLGGDGRRGRLHPTRE